MIVCVDSPEVSDVLPGVSENNDHLMFIWHGSEELCLYGRVGLGLGGIKRYKSNCCLLWRSHFYYDLVKIALAVSLTSR